MQIWKRLGNIGSQGNNVRRTLPSFFSAKDETQCGRQLFGHGGRRITKGGENFAFPFCRNNLLILAL